jgi:hypothetical protein
MPERGSEKETSTDLRAVVEREISHALMWKGILDFQDTSVSRKKLLERFEKIVRLFPRSEHYERAKETAEILRQMIREDEEHAKKAVKPFEELSEKEQIAELIYRLRDHSLYEQNGPGDQLVEYGFDAVPLLMELLGDKRFTREICCWRWYCFSHSVIDYDSRARDIIGHIAGVSFSRMGYTEESAKEAIESWWAQVQSKGEKNVLIEITRLGTVDSIDAARRLFNKYPDSALEPVIEGARKATFHYERNGLIRIASGIEGNGPVPFLLEELSNGPFLSSRVAAAWGLVRHGYSFAVYPMIREWENLPKKEPGYEDEGYSEIVEFLTNCGNTRAIGALRKSYGECPVELRLAIISSLGSADNLSYISVGHHTGISAGKDEPKGIQEDEAVLAAVEALLVFALKDTEEQLGMSGCWNDKPFCDPRICDVAARILVQRWPGRYEFNPTAPLSIRDRQRLEMANIWRTEHGLLTVPIPEPRTIQEVPQEKIQPLLDQILKARSAESCTRALRQVEVLGLPALPAILDLLECIGRDHAAREEIEVLSKRLACIVEEVVIDPQSEQMEEGLKHALHGAKGRPLTAAAFAELFVRMARELEGHEGQVRLAADRNGDNMGVILSARFVKRNELSLDASSVGGMAQSVSICGNCIHNSYGGLPFDEGTPAECHRDLVKAVNKALESPPESFFGLRVNLAYRVEEAVQAQERATASPLPVLVITAVSVVVFGILLLLTRRRRRSQ